MNHVHACLGHDTLLGGLVNGGAGEAKICGVRESAHEIVAQIAAGGTVGFIHQHKDILSLIYLRRDIIKLVNHGDDKASGIASEKFL